MCGCVCVRVPEAFVILRLECTDASLLGETDVYTYAAHAHTRAHPHTHTRTRTQRRVVLLMLTRLEDLFMSHRANEVVSRHLPGPVVTELRHALATCLGT